MKPFISLIKKKQKKQPLRFTRVFWFASNKLWRVNPRVQLFIASKCRLRLNERKLSNRLTAAILKDCRLKNIENSKYQLIFATAEEVLSKPFLSWLKKKLPTVLLIGATYLSFCRKTVLAVFNLTYFDWLLAPFRKYSVVQPIRGCFTFQQPLHTSVFSPILCPQPLPSTLTLNQTRTVG